MILTASHCVQNKHLKKTYVFFHYNIARKPSKDPIRRYDFMHCMHKDTSCPEPTPMAAVIKVDRIGELKVDLALAYFDEDAIQPYLESLNPNVRPKPTPIHTDTSPIDQVTHGVLEGYGQTKQYYFKNYSHDSLTRLRKIHLKMYPYSRLHEMDDADIQFIIDSQAEKHRLDLQDPTLLPMLKETLHFNAQFAHHALFYKSPFYRSKHKTNKLLGIGCGSVRW